MKLNIPPQFKFEFGILLTFLRNYISPNGYQLFWNLAIKSWNFPPIFVKVLKIAPYQWGCAAKTTLLLSSGQSRSGWHFLQKNFLCSKLPSIFEIEIGSMNYSEMKDDDWFITIVDNKLNALKLPEKETVLNFVQIKYSNSYYLCFKSYPKERSRS